MTKRLPAPTKTKRLKTPRVGAGSGAYHWKIGRGGIYYSNQIKRDRNKTFSACDQVAGVLGFAAWHARDG